MCGVNGEWKKISKKTQYDTTKRVDKYYQFRRTDGDRSAPVMRSSMSRRATVSQCRPALESFRCFLIVPFTIARIRYTPSQ